MPRRLLTSLAIVFALSLVLNSVPASAKSQLGFRGGINIGSRTSDPESDLDHRRKTDGLFGVVIQAALNDKNTVLIRGDVSYVGRGWYEDSYVNDDVVETTFSTDEIAFGPALVLRGKDKKFPVFAEVGLEVAAVVRKHAEAEYQGRTLKSDIPEYSTNNISINLGVGVTFPAKSDEIQAALRYSNGLKNMIDSKYDVTVKTTSIQFLIGYYFTLKK